MECGCDWKGDMIESKIGVYAHDYPPETSPVIKGLISYLASKQIDLHLIVTSLEIDKHFKVQSIPIIELCPKQLQFIKNKILTLKGIRSSIVIRRLNKLSIALVNNLIFIFSRWKLGNIVSTYDCIIAIEWLAIKELSKVGYPLSKTIYFSLEAEDILKTYDSKNFVNKLLSQCAFCIIQSWERGEGLTRYLGIHLNYEYLPVSMRPVDNSINVQNESVSNNSEIRIVYSGYIAEWSGLRQFLDGFSGLSLDIPVSIELHGHYKGTDLYFQRICSYRENDINLIISTDYLEDEDHLKYLANFDVGLAFYTSQLSTSNWENLLFSSGKIASYLWAGLAVLTNIKKADEMGPPFLYLHDFSEHEIKIKLEMYLSRKQEYQLAARKFADEFYNLDKHMDSILKRIQEVV